MNDFLKVVTVQAVIAISIVIGGLLMLAFLDLKESVEVSLVNLMIMVASYFFGSSRSTAKKDETIADIAASNNK